MTTSLALSLLGYTASVLIAASLLMRSIVRLRAINLLGAAAFSLYGFLIGAYPVGMLNLLTVSINIVQLVRLQRRREIFRILEIRGDSPYLEYFVDFQAEDIARFFPGFRFDPATFDLVLLVLRDLSPAGLLLATTRDTTLDVQLDYVLPQYRDLKVGRFLFTDEVAFFTGRGLREILTRAETRAHAEYLERVGFAPGADGETYRLSLAPA